jgi:hypothetical protein
MNFPSHPQQSPDPRLSIVNQRLQIHLPTITKKSSTPKTAVNNLAETIARNDLKGLKDVCRPTSRLIIEGTSPFTLPYVVDYNFPNLPCTRRAPDITAKVYFTQGAKMSYRRQRYVGWVKPIIGHTLISAQAQCGPATDNEPYFVIRLPPPTHPADKCGEWGNSRQRANYHATIDNHFSDCQLPNTQRLFVGA